LQARRTANRL